MHGEVKTPPMSRETRIETGAMLRAVQRGELLSLPLSRPLPTIGPGCHELRVADVETGCEWRLIYYIGSSAIAVLEVFQKKTRVTPGNVLANCRRRLADFKRRDAP